MPYVYGTDQAVDSGSSYGAATLMVAGETYPAARALGVSCGAASGAASGSSVIYGSISMSLQDGSIVTAPLSHQWQVLPFRAVSYALLGSVNAAVVVYGLG